MQGPNDNANSTQQSSPRIVVVSGATGTGKTALGIELALRFDGEIVNSDSRYFYRGFDIGVAKPDPEERQGIPHHLIDIIEPHDEMSLALYQKRAMNAIRTVLERHRLPLLVGGSPLYSRALVEGWRIPEVAPNDAFRKRMTDIAERNGVEALRHQLGEIDPESARKSGSNLRRIIRALEVFDETGTPMSHLQGKGPRPFRTLEIGLTMPREALYERIDARVDRLIEQGLEREIRTLLQEGVSPTCPAFSSIGYRQFLPCLSGQITLDQAIEAIKHDTHRYVRHQETWLRKNPRLVRIDVLEPTWIERAERLVRKFLEE